MLRTCAFFCALAGFGTICGCNSPPNGNPPANTRDETMREMKTKLDELDRHIDDLKHKAEKATGEEKAKLEAQWKEVSARKGEFAQKYEKLKNAAGNEWQDLKNEADHDYNEAKKYLSR